MTGGVMLPPFGRVVRGEIGLSGFGKRWQFLWAAMTGRI
jgi:hypothetical protein